MKSTKLYKGIGAIALIGGALIVGPAVYAQGIGVPTFKDQLVPTKSKIERGKVVFERNCSNCHGPDGAGNTPVGAQIEQMPNFQTATYNRGGGPVQIYNVVTKGTGNHPVLSNLAYQDAWAVTHYVRSLGETKGLTDPPQTMATALEEAEKGLCKEAVKATVESKVKFQGEEQVKLGATSYAANCSSCHGDAGAGDGPAAAALQPPPRDFTTAEQKWTNGSSPLAIFNTLTNGIAGTSMASFAHLPEEERWALAHMIREKWVPAAARQESTPEQIVDVCRSLSAEGSTVSIPIESAMKFLVQDQGEQRNLRMKGYGTTWVTDGADGRRGEQVYGQHCQMCHGPQGSGGQMGPYGSQPPYLFVTVGALEPASAGGSFNEFAKRSISGAHTSIPDMTGVAAIAEDDWKALHAFISAFEGAGETRPASTRPAEDAMPDDEPATDGQPTDGQPTDGATTDPAPADTAPSQQPAAADSAPEKPAEAKPAEAPEKPAPAAKPAEQPAEKPAAQPSDNEEAEGEE